MLRAKVGGAPGKMKIMVIKVHMKDSTRPSIYNGSLLCSKGCPWIIGR